jgi:hypothetical protein
MKKILLCLVTVLFSIGILTGCGSTTATLSDYAIFEPHTVYRYSVSGDERAADNALASQHIYNDYIHADEGLYQRRIVAGELLIGECMRIADGEMTSYFSSNRFNFFYDMTKAESNGSALVLKEPLTKGATWTRTSGTTADGTTIDLVAEVTAENVDVTVPYGTFKAIEITVTRPESEEYIKEYYAKDIGLIKTEQRAATTEPDGTMYYTDLSSELEAIDKNMDYSDTGYFFYPDFATNEIIYENHEITHRTNEDPAEALEAVLKSYSNLPENTFIGADTKVNSVELNYNEGKIKADFSEGLETALSQDPATEELYIQALINTVGYYFDTSDVLITVDGEGYEGNITMSADEYRDVKASIKVDNTPVGESIEP